MEKLKEIYNKYMNTKGLVIILIIGVGLLVIPGLGSGSKKDKSQNGFKELQAIKISTYEEETEKRLAKMLSTINGAKDVSVMITFSDTGKYVYSLDEESEQGKESRKDSSKPALKNDAGGGQSALLVKAELPQISGVLVTAVGADDSTVAENLTSAVKAVLDVKANRVRILAK